MPNKKFGFCILLCGVIDVSKIEDNLTIIHIVILNTSLYRLNSYIIL